jgi:hypothetical protein
MRDMRMAFEELEKRARALTVKEKATGLSLKVERVCWIGYLLQPDT